MTLPTEEFYTLAYTRAFLFELLDPLKTPNVPSKVRQKAVNCLKHYPDLGRLEDLYEGVVPRIPKRY